MKTSTSLKRPQLPKHLDEYLDRRWTKRASLEVDKWLYYVELEFQGVDK